MKKKIGNFGTKTITENFLSKMPFNKVSLKRVLLFIYRFNDVFICLVGVLRRTPVCFPSMTTSTIMVGGNRTVTGRKPDSNREDTGQ